MQTPAHRSPQRNRATAPPASGWKCSQRAKRAPAATPAQGDGSPLTHSRPVLLGHLHIFGHDAGRSVFPPPRFARGRKHFGASHGEGNTLAPRFAVEGESLKTPAAAAG